MVWIVKADARLATETLAKIVVPYICEGVSRVFLVEGKWGERPVMVMLLQRPVGPALPLEHLIKGLK
jgi:hypothetical protein